MSLKNVMLLKRLDNCFVQIIKLSSEKLQLEKFIKKYIDKHLKINNKKRSLSDKKISNEKDKKEVEELIKRKNSKNEENKINFPVLKEYKPISTKNIKKYIFEFEKILLTHRKKLFDNLKQELTDIAKKNTITSQSIQETKMKFYNNLGDNFLKNFSEEQTKELIENYIFEALHKYIFFVSDDAEMKNKQIKEKIGILQTYIKPEILGIKEKYVNMKVYNTAICGSLKRVTQNK